MRKEAAVYKEQPCVTKSVQTRAGFLWENASDKVIADWDRIVAHISKSHFPAVESSFYLRKVFLDVKIKTGNNKAIKV